MPEEEKRLTYGQHVMKCIEEYCVARERFQSCLRGGLPFRMHELNQEVCERRKAAEQAIDEILKDFVEA